MDIAIFWYAMFRIKMRNRTKWRKVAGRVTAPRCGICTEWEIVTLCSPECKCDCNFELRATVDETVSSQLLCLGEVYALMFCSTTGFDEHHFIKCYLIGKSAPLLNGVQIKTILLLLERNIAGAFCRVQDSTRSAQLGSRSNYRHYEVQSTPSLLTAAYTVARLLLRTIISES